MRYSNITSNWYIFLENIKNSNCSLLQNPTMGPHSGSYNYLVKYHLGQEITNADPLTRPPIEIPLLLESNQVYYNELYSKQVHIIIILYLYLRMTTRCSFLMTLSRLQLHRYNELEFRFLFMQTSNHCHKESVFVSSHCLSYLVGFLVLKSWVFWNRCRLMQLSINCAY